ncbi:MAG: AMP-binding protein [Chloroflexi bacterium]|uniref:AMP-binding protein n=1 Tax=Candidatus Chlorohelix allophototropha TaxID=3003348 RepID=A0A8T7M029_9CHLR|nr:AMP-binding protein [Chloroflexota bacterium]WJW66530.1 AMP-binding protein [Chloroflexota bacterium L227-S17]
MSINADTANIGDYETTYRDFKLEVPEFYNFGYDTVDKWGEDPNHRAMLWVDEDGSERTLSYAYFRDRSNQVVNALHSLGMRKGDRVMIVMPRVPEWWESLLGMIKSGIIALPGTTQLTPKDITYRLQSSRARAIITDVENAPKFEESLPDCPGIDFRIIVGGQREGWLNFADLVDKAAITVSPEVKVQTSSSDPMLLYFTSGTTGYPKMVLHTHSSYPIGHYGTGTFWLDLKPNDLHWNLSDTGWAKAAWSSFFGPLICGAGMFVHNTKGKYSAKLTMDLLSKYAVTSFCAPPTAYRMLVADDISGFDTRHLRSCVGAGEPLNPEVIEIWKNITGHTIRDGYGQTETCLLVGNFPGMEVKVGSMGKPAPGYVVDVLDDDGNPALPNKEGDIGVRIKPNRPVGLFQEYWNNPEATNASIRGDWYLTGDRAYRDEDGYLWFVGRADDVILSAGYRIGPFEVESALVEHPAVMESAVVAKPEPTRGEIVKAFVILKPGIEGTPELVTEIQDFVKHLTAPYKYPREIEFVKELPKTISGKIRRIELRDQEKAKYQSEHQ